MQEYCSKNSINYIYKPFNVGAVGFCVSYGELQYPSNPEEVNRSLESLFEILLDRRNYPILINCLKGQESGFVLKVYFQHFTGILVACIRRLQQWSMSSIFTEYGHCSLLTSRFAHFEKKMQVYDMLVVELFKVNLTASPEYLPDWITVEEYENMKVLLANNSTMN